MYVLDRVDGDTAAADFTEAQRIVAVAPHQRGQVERGRETGVHALGVLEQVLEPLVRVVGRTEAGELPHRPQPERYMVSWTPRVNGYCPGSPMRAWGWDGFDESVVGTDSGP